MSQYSKSELSQLKLIEDTVNNYLSKVGASKNPGDDRHLTKVIKMVTENALLPSKTVHINWNSNAKKPFIMSITPNVNELFTKTQEFMKIMNKVEKLSQDAKTEFLRKWAEIKEWFIEIDTRVVTADSRLCVDDGGQFVALLCHEIGHVMMENPLNLLYQYKVNSMRFTTLERLMLSNSRVVRALLLPMFLHTSQFMVVVDNIHNGKSKELAADMYVPDEYRGALISYMDNHLLKHPDTIGLFMDKKTFDQEQSTAINLSKETLTMLKGRREILNQQIKMQYNDGNNSQSQKVLMRVMGRNVTGYDPKTDKAINEYLYSNAFDRDFVMESMNASNILMEATVTSRELDVLALQVDAIETTEDKMYLMHRVYDYMEAVQTELDKKAAKDAKNTVKQHSKPLPKSLQIDNRMEQLKGIRDKIMNTHVESKTMHIGGLHGIFVDYPKGYEG